MSALPIAKTQQVRDLWAAGKKIDALRIAKGFRMGDPRDKQVIQRAWEAKTNASMYRQMKKDPDAMLEAGFLVMERIYG